MRPDPSAFTSRAKLAAAIASEALAPALRLGARARCGPPTPPSAWRRGVILGHGHIGDVLCRTPSLAPLRAALPGCEWDYVAAPHAVDVLAHEPNVRAVVRAERGAGGWSWSGLPWQTLRAARYDVALCTAAVGAEADFLLALALRIPNRVGVSHKGLTGLLTRAVDSPRAAPPGAYLRAIVGALGDVPPAWGLRPVLRTTREDAVAGAGAHARATGGARALVACALTTRQQQPRWPDDRFLDTLGRVHAETGAAIALCGTSDDRPVLAALAARASFPCVVVAGELGVRAFAELLRRCAAVLTVDTGTRHLANAVGTRCAFLRNLRTTAGEGGAYVDSERDLLADVGPCAGAAATRALARLTPMTVASTVVAMMREDRA